MQSNWAYEITELFLHNETNAAILTTEGEIIHSKSDLGFETPGFRSTVEGALKYIHAKPGDIIVSNDPYSGGSFLHRYNFLLVLSLPEMNSAGFVLCVR
ncbi:MAG: hydantoinase B/oxoprolinase family protein, partial [Bdellovibrionaceae bacterium]|nr:hydantoinase B/oxoprolinase family protein [Pseudobdellovibrionaceae bacterium]